MIFIMTVCTTLSDNYQCYIVTKNLKSAMCVYSKLAEEKFIILWDIGTNFVNKRLE